jgi:hypothetical protein
MLFAARPRNYVGKLYGRLPASGNSAAMTSFDENLSPKGEWDRRPFVIHWTKSKAKK